jgi:hypothetical protein
MTLLFSQLKNLANDPMTRNHPDVAKLRPYVNGAVVIDIQNVAEFYWQHEQDVWDLYKDFPNVAPPFNVFWTEYQAPHKVHAEGHYGVHPMAGRPFGALFIAERETEKEFNWRMSIVPFGTTPSGQLSRLGLSLLFAVSADGLVVPIDPSMSDRSFYIVMDESTRKQFEESPHEQQLTITALANAYLKPSLLALCFMHCKNVVISDQQLPRHERRQAQRNGQDPHFTYKVLDIRPMKEVLRTEGQIETTGLKRALHICRGHFANYTDGPGLFGKYHGVFWKEAHVRGKAKQGVVVKDYSVKQPVSH